MCVCTQVCEGVSHSVFAMSSHSRGVVQNGEDDMEGWEDGETIPSSATFEKEKVTLTHSLAYDERPMFFSQPFIDTPSSRKMLLPESHWVLHTHTQQLHTHENTHCSLAGFLLVCFSSRFVCFVLGCFFKIVCISCHFFVSWELNCSFFIS